MPEPASYLEANHSRPPFTPLPRSFYDPSASVAASQLLGHYLIRNTPHGPSGGRIVETEAYLVDDPACHGSIGETPRNKTLYGPPGHAYVYLIYGFHCCFNTVCRPRGHAEAVLVRAIEADIGEEWMQAQRPVSEPHQLTSGPGKLCAALAIDRSQDGVDLCDPKSPVYVAENPEREQFLRERGPLVTTTRIGIRLAAEWPLRFYLENSPFVSRRIPRKKAARRARQVAPKSKAASSRRTPRR